MKNFFNARIGVLVRKCTVSSLCKSMDVIQRYWVLFEKVSILEKQGCMDFEEKRLSGNAWSRREIRGGLVVLSPVENCPSSKIFAFQDYRMLNNRKILNMFLQDGRFLGGQKCLHVYFLILSVMTNLTVTYLCLGKHEENFAVCFNQLCFCSLSVMSACS